MPACFATARGGSGPALRTAIQSQRGTLNRLPDDIELVLLAIQEALINALFTAITTIVRKQSASPQP